MEFIVDRTVVDAGLSFSSHKSVNASQVMTFLGIKFDSPQVMMKVTEEN